MRVTDRRYIDGDVRCKFWAGGAPMNTLLAPVTGWGAEILGARHARRHSAVQHQRFLGRVGSGDVTAAEDWRRAQGD